MWSTVSSGGLPAGERFEWFSDLVSREVMPTVISSERPASFHAEAAVMELGELRVSRLAYSPLRSRRTPALIRRSDPEQYQLALVSAGAMSLAQHGNDCGAGVGDLVFWDTSRPSDARSPTGDDREQQLVILQLPRTVLPLRPRQLDRLLARRIAGGSGMTPVLASFMTSLVDYGDQCSPTQLRQLGTVAADLAAACLAQQLDTEEQLPAEVRQRALVQQIHTYIEHNLGDPQLNPRSSPPDTASRYASSTSSSTAMTRASTAGSADAAWSGAAPIWPCPAPWPGRSISSPPAGVQWAGGLQPRVP